MFYAATIKGQSGQITVTVEAKTDETALKKANKIANAAFYSEEVSISLTKID